MSTTIAIPIQKMFFGVVEYSNISLSKDLEVKTGVYASASIQEYWVVNLKESKLIVFRHSQDGAYQTEFEPDAEIIPLAFPNIAILKNKILG